MLRLGRKEKDKWVKSEAQKKGKHSRTFESVRDERLQQEYEVAEAVYRSQMDMVKKQSKLEAKEKKKEAAEAAAAVEAVEAEKALATAIEESLKLAALENPATDGDVDPASDVPSELKPTIVLIPPKEGESVSSVGAVEPKEDGVEEAEDSPAGNEELPPIV
mmetsp:Transcript_28672/g.44566  ORF Transcript_28672/g.44566 Transcript_28672/m.44566 type:complete len:162 (-) Transcript_28672:117-602(-)|eukprot:CAMPEP_0196803480 /NCGR_PEP_ID=MMETSP1362-20130617/2905_1 /TAXON_ID=163516 /ORGANISM="Leptocylindrus danicus, Strain CCMP1856" /LENGTH=161 /DNA_ID=CAMNT_0042175107 /DNA_START=387 /DNA_END=872 /DNA_ORIENTATION=-